MAKRSVIRLRGLTQHNLKNLDLDIPLNQLIAVSGVSGSGKSSLAIHTLYAEGQRRYVETFSPYARQFLERMDPPRAQCIDGIPPSIAIESGTSVRSSRSTVGTITEINDYLKLLFARLAIPYCQQCNQPVFQDTSESIHERLNDVPADTRMLIVFPWSSSEEGEKFSQGSAVREFLISQGFLRIFHGGQILDLETIAEDPLRNIFAQEVLVVVDRFIWGRISPERVRDSIGTAMRMGKERMAVVIFPDRIRWFSGELACAACHNGEMIPPSTPNLFSFNSPVGACPECRGFGRTIGVDLDLVIPDPRLSLEEGAIKPWGKEWDEYQDLLQFCRRTGIPTDIPFADLDPSAKERIINGSENFYGIRGFFEWLESKSYKMHVRVLLSRYRAYNPCSTCGGTRYQRATLIYRLNGLTIAKLNRFSVSKCLEFFQNLQPDVIDDPAASLLVSEILNRLRFLHEVGLDYLALDRQSRTLSGGEVQRVHLTRALGSALVNVLYVLDEPSVGLHARDQKRLMEQLRKLVSLGNTVIMVEHDPEMIRFCDQVIDMGPLGGEKGGEVIYQGPPAGLGSCELSLTGKYMREMSPLINVKNKSRIPDPDRAILIRGARENNLKNLNVSLPLGLFVGISGASGSGKSTLIKKILYANWLRYRGLPTESPGACDGIEGFDLIKNMVLVDQQPIGRSPRANLLTYTQALNIVRNIFAKTPEAIARNYSARHFSFNMPGGRCEVCKGEGFERIEMQFLADVFVRCSHCEGRRYRDEILEVRVNGLSIADVLECTAPELLERFGQSDQLSDALRPIREIGLDYLRLGQPLSTLSGGEAQRLKLLRYLNSKKDGNTLFLLDEPTVGLHPYDLTRLLDVLNRLIDLGNSVVVIEHNLDFLKACDWIIDLGPEGGEDGGSIVAAGPPAHIAKHPQSHTGRCLKERLEGKSHKGPVELFRSKKTMTSMAEEEILVRGAREHNLEIAEVRLPRNKITVLTGLSGSGKSTLAFDVLFAEGQRRYLECLSTYVRQYFKILEKPDVDLVIGLPPTVAIEQRTSQLGRKSTVGTITEIYHFLRLLYSKLGKQFCPTCGDELVSLSFDQILGHIADMATRENLRLLAPLVRSRKGIYQDLFQRLKRLGFEKVRVDGKWLPLEPIPVLERHREHDIEVLVAEIARGQTGVDELAQMVKNSLNLGSGALILDGEQEQVFSERFYCINCNQGLPPLDPRLFSFNSHHGACFRCNGSGNIRRLDLDRLLGHKDIPLKDGLLRFLTTTNWPETFKMSIKRLVRFWTQSLNISHEQPFSSLDEGTRDLILHGGRGIAGGLIGIFEQMIKEESTSMMEPFISEHPCPECRGERLNAQARAVRFKGWSIGELTHLSIADFIKEWKSFSIEKLEEAIMAPISREILARSAFLDKVGLEYLSLDRSGETLSGGETQRIRLAAQLGSNLRGVCYILDEPTIGLHPVDSGRLLNSLRRLQQKGNTIIIMEHDPETMRRADVLVELGPEAGSGGGKLVAQGSFKDLCANPETLTGKWFSKLQINMDEISAKDWHQKNAWLEFIGVSARNLKRIDVRIPLGTITTVTGVSGAGKSTLVHEVIYRVLDDFLQRRYGGPGVQVLEIRGLDDVKRVLEVDHKPIGRTPRSIPATYVGVFDEIRKLFAALPEARARGFTPGRFSFNVKGGRCEECKGQGEIKVAMHFLPNVHVPCGTCRGTRFASETLKVKFKGKSIADVLQMTFSEAKELFGAVPTICRPMEILCDLGLGYLRLGQPSPTLSGGEAQRIKLAGELGGNRNGTLYILDEPTTGLHRADVIKLLKVLKALRARGNTILAVEHNLDFIWASDYIIDLGPGCGERGGKVVAAGTPQELLRQQRHSATARALAKYLKTETSQ